MILLMEDSSIESEMGCEKNVSRIDSSFALATFSQLTGSLADNDDYYNTPRSTPIAFTVRAYR